MRFTAGEYQGSTPGQWQVEGEELVAGISYISWRIQINFRNNRALLLMDHLTKSGWGRKEGAKQDSRMAMKMMNNLNYAK